MPQEKIVNVKECSFSGAEIKRKAHRYKKKISLLAVYFNAAYVGGGCHIYFFANQPCLILLHLPFIAMSHGRYIRSPAV